TLSVLPAACKPGKVVEASDIEKPRAQRNNNSVDIGSPLYKPREMQKLPADLSVQDPILIPAHVAIMDKADIPSRHDGQILFIGTEAKPGEKVDYEHLDPFTEKVKGYRRLKPSDRVEAGSVVVLLDDQEAV